jgi:hypothetical protein
MATDHNKSAITNTSARPFLSLLNASETEKIYTSSGNNHRTQPYGETTMSTTFIQNTIASTLMAAGMLWLSLPASAQNVGVIQQTSSQGTVQMGNGNVGINNSQQDASLHQSQFWPGSGPNIGGISQSSQQSLGQIGNGNVGANNSNQSGVLGQHSSFFGSGGPNVGGISQGSAQGMGQLGNGNFGLNNNGQSSNIFQY